MGAFILNIIPNNKHNTNGPHKSQSFNCLIIFRSSSDKSVVVESICGVAGVVDGVVVDGGVDVAPFVVFTVVGSLVETTL